MTKDELLRNLTGTEASNGFGNRFLWLFVQRSKELPFPSMPDDSKMAELASRVGRAIRDARSIDAIGMTESFREKWKAVYRTLSADRPGLAGFLLGRAEAHVMRISALYAVLDGQHDMDLIHLNAALALWNHAEASTHLVVGDNTGDPEADTILRALRERGALTDTDISGLFKGHTPALRLKQAKAILESAGLIYQESMITEGRSRTIWMPVAK